VQAGPRMPSFDPAVLDQVAELPGVAAVAGIYYDIASIDGRAGQFVTAVNDPVAFQTIFSIEQRDGRLDVLGDGQLLADDETAEEHGLSIGSTVSVQLSRGEARTYTLTGVYKRSDDYAGFVLPDTAATNFAIPQPSQGFIQLVPGASAQEVQSQVEQLLVDNPEVSVADRSAYIEERLGLVDQLLVMIQILLALAILIAVLGIVNTLALSVLERTRELGLLRAIGLSRTATMRMITIEAVVISVFGALLGVLVGAGLGAAVVRALREEGITDLVLPWGQMVWFLALAAIVGVLAAVLPAIRAARLNVLNAIAHE
jgi:putative ABC transport system permease protein